MLLVQYGPGALPTYFFPPRMCGRICSWTRRSATAGRSSAYGPASAWCRQAAWAYAAPPPGLERLDGHITFDWEAADAWLEEDEQVFVHARDPHKRVDVMASSRYVEVRLAGQAIANSRRPHLLFETHLPTRYYLPREEVRMDLLLPSPTTIRCPYKGVATYWSVRAGGRIHEDLAWTYEDPIAENPKIRGLVAFFNERVDLLVDGTPLAKPLTPWSR